MSDRIHFLLCDPATGQAVFPEGLPVNVAREAARGLGAELPGPVKLGGDVLADFGADPGALDRQRWGIVAPRGERGKALLAAVEPLRRRRAEQQVDSVVVYEVPPDMSAVATAEWLRTDYLNAVDRRVERLPRFLLLLGGPEDISWAAQQQMASVAMPGRLSFHCPDGSPDLEGYRLYTKKLLAAESAPPREPVVLFYTTRDGQSTEDGNNGVVLPNLLALRSGEDGVTAREFGVTAPRPGAGSQLVGPAREVRAAVREQGTVLLSLSLGVGGSWGSAAEQRARQGAPKWGNDILTAADVGTGPFLPGGAWILFACYSAGTPNDSLYSHWASRVPNIDEWMGRSTFLECRPMDGVPFVAAIPEAALRNESGPLVVMGHVDLALTGSFSDLVAEPGSKGKQTYPERFHGALLSLALGRRAGVAFDNLARGARDLDAELAAQEDATVQATARSTPEPPRGAGPSTATPTDAGARRAARWLQRQDLRSFVLLGDPAARLRVGASPSKAARKAPVATTHATATARGTATTQAAAITEAAATTEAAAIAEAVATMERAVIDHLKGAPLSEIASRAGASEAEVLRWADRYQSAGRAALGKLRR